MDNNSTLRTLLKSSDSLRRLEAVTSKIPERSFHKFTHMLYDLRTLLGPEPKTYMEIGTYCGSSAALMLTHAHETRVVCIDPLKLPAKHFRGTMSQEATVLKNVAPFEAESEKNTLIMFKNLSTDPALLTDLKKSGIDKVDLLFIDGDHSRQAVLFDFKTFAPLVAPGGYIVFDDYMDARWCPQVRPAVDSIVQTLQTSDEFEVIGCLPDYQNAAIDHAQFRDFGGLANNFILRRRL